MLNSWHISSLGAFLSWAALTGCAAVPAWPPADTVQVPSSHASATLSEAPHEVPLPPPSVPSASLALERKVRLQEKRIAELSTQLRLLKRIDLDRSKP